MNRFSSKQRKRQREKIENIAEQSSATLIEKEEKIVAKLLSGQCYDKDDMKKCAKSILSQDNYDYKDQFLLVKNITEFDNMNLKESEPFFVIFDKSDQRWVIVCIINTEDKKYQIFYKDSSGEDIPFTLEKKIREMLIDVEFIINTSKEHEVDQEYYYSPLALRNLDIIVKCLQEDYDEFLIKFPDICFFSADNLDNDKFKIVVQLTNELAEKEEFKSALNEFISKIPVELGSSLVEYKKILEEELEKDENDVNWMKIEEARKHILTQKNIEKIKNDFNLNKQEKDGEITGYELDIQSKFSDEMKKLELIFTVFENVEVDKNLYVALENVSEILDIDFEKMKLFYEFRVKKISEQKENSCVCLSIEEITQKLPEMNKVMVEENTPLEELLDDIVLGMDLDPQPPEEKEKLKQKHRLVKTKYLKWSDTSLEDIDSWGRKTKGNLSSTEDDICEAISVMDRALNILTGGHRLRDTQILAVLIFFQNNQGRLCQIKTGEGKTVIVSLLAVIKALQGYTVDIITSNSVLASDGVNETINFYSVFGLRVGTNNPGDYNFDYTADIIYGTISNFQFDYLKDTFEGFTIRKNRKFGQVILDEVDSMLVDNGGHIAKLASPYPGMECFRYIYINIWQELQKAEESFAEETQEKMKKFLTNNNYSDRNEARQKYEKFVQETIKNERRIIKDKIKASNPTDIPLIPKHLKKYVKSKTDTWIKNALRAKYNCHEHQQYRLLEDEDGEKIVTPVDYLNTGVTMKNTIWSNGLHQFIQLKHNLQLTFESLTSSFISNIGYVHNYDDRNIFGLTGTLGSQAEQELLSQIYNINYAKLPTYKKKTFEELSGIIVSDDSWSNEVTINMLKKIDQKRAVLLICETEHDLLSIQKNLEILQDDSYKIRLYANEDYAKEIRKKVDIGDIILATNIAGRGTNFRTEKRLEENGGLHVCVGFLPCNLRVEGQAFGRTSRQGNNGTAQLIIRKSEVEELGIFDENLDFTTIKNERDRLEKDRLKQIKEVLLKELNFKDKIFTHFSQFYRSLNSRNMTDSYRVVLQDLKEFWAFWLESKNFKATNIEGTNPGREFEKFVGEASSIISGTISHNPFYCISLADHYLEDNSRAKAASILKHALEMGGTDNFNLLPGAHVKLFEVAIADGEQAMERFRKAMANIFFINVKKNEHYKNEAVRHLTNAKISLDKEIIYIEQRLTGGDSNKNFCKILIQTEDDNIFVKHIYSRLYCLKVHKERVDQLIETIQTTSQGIDINGKAESNLKSFEQMNVPPKIVTNIELIELRSIGIDAIYSLREICDVPDTVINAAQGQIIAGIAALTAGLCFPPIFPLMSPLASTLISDGVMDIALEILKQDSSQFNKKEFMKEKFISAAVSLFTLGISAIAQSVRILTKAVSFCRKISTFLRNSTRLQKLCAKIATLVDKLGDVLEKMLVMAKFNKLSKLEQLDELSKLQKSGNLEKFEHLGGLKKLTELQQMKNLGELSRVQLVTNFAKEIAVSNAKQITKNLIDKYVIQPLTEWGILHILDEMHLTIRSRLMPIITLIITSNGTVVEKIRTTPFENIHSAIDSFMEKNEDRKIAWAREGLNFVSNFFSYANLITITYDIEEGVRNIIKHFTTLNTYLLDSLEGGNMCNNIEETIFKIVVILSDKMASELKDLILNIHTAKDLYYKAGKSCYKFVYNKLHPKPVIIEGYFETNEIVVLPSSSLESIGSSSTVDAPTKSAYTVLSLPENASFDEVKKQYRKLALLLHPDKGRVNGPEKFQEISNAYQEICDARKKQDHCENSNENST